MKQLNNYIIEKLKITKNKFKGRTECTLFPKTKNELFKILYDEIDNKGPKCSLNHIDTSQIEDMSNLFSWTHSLAHWNGDLSEWDVSNVTNMIEMFKGSAFNGDLSRWDVSRVENMRDMFESAHFNNDSICDWDVSNVENMSGMFWNSAFDQDISGWDVSNVVNMECMFSKSAFNHDISNWEINPKCNTKNIFWNSIINREYMPKKKK